MRKTLVAFLVAAAIGCDGRPRRRDPQAFDSPGDFVSGPRVAELNLRAGAGEQGTTSWLSGRSRSFSELVLKLDDLSRDSDIRGVFVRFGVASLGVARAEELGRALAVHRRVHPVVCHADGYDNASLLAAATGCSELWLSPAGTVDSIGIAAQLVFARSLFDKLGVKVDFMQEGRFKGAEETFTRDAPSEPARHSLEAALSAIRTAWLAGIETGRGAKAQELGVEDGPHAASEALSKRLVDRIGFESEARKRALELAEVSGRNIEFGSSSDAPSGLSELVRGLAGAPQVGVPHVAVVRATGAIAMAGGGLGTGDAITRTELGATLAELARDPLTKAVVLRIDSPGGSALASDLLWNDVMELRKRKPVVASIGGMAASGGYYIASAATKIIAERSSVVGSIGVVMGKLSVGESLAQIGVNVTVVPARAGTEARAAYKSPFLEWDEGTRARLRASMSQTYQLFLERIAEGRSTQVEAIVPAAEGRIMGGEDALTKGLIDEVGGLLRAIDLARELAGSDSDLPAHVERGGGGWLELVDGAHGTEMSRSKVEHSARELVAGAVLGPLAKSRLVEEEMAWIAGLALPLADGEHALAANPFALKIR